MSDSSTVVIGCDSGTRAVKAVAMTMTGALVASAIEPHPAVRLTPDGGAEQNAVALLGALERALSRAARAAGARRVAAVALTTQRDCVAPLQGRLPVRPMFSWMDRRRVDRQFVPRAFRDPRLAALFEHSRAQWVARHEPRTYSKITHWATIGAYFHLYLCDRLADSSASLPAAFPIDRWTPGWTADHESWAAAGLTRSSVHDIVPAGSIIGRVGRRAARRTGIAEGTPVVATGGDKNCEVLGGAALDPSCGVLSLGTALSVGTMVADSRRYQSAPLWTTAAPIAGWWTVEAGVPAGLWTLDRLARAFPVPPRSRPRRPPTRDGLTVVPYFLGHVSRPDARGVIAGLGPTHHGRDVQLAAMEGLGFEARRAVEAIEHVTGQRMRVVRFVGGGIANRPLCAIVAAALNRRVRIARDGLAGARGAAAVAALALRPGSLERVRRFTAPAITSAVDRDLRRAYAHIYERRYRELADAVLSG